MLETVDFNKVISDNISVVAEKMNTNQSFPSMFIDTIGQYGNIKNYDLAKTNGLYRISGPMNDGNEPPLTGVYGILRVDVAFKYITQTAISISSCEIFVRGINDDTPSSSWTDWRKV